MSTAPARTLDGRVVVVDVLAAGVARALAAAGAIVVVIGSEADADAVGQLVGELVAGGSRAAAFVGDPTRPEVADALAELVGELFPVVPASTPEPA